MILLIPMQDDDREMEIWNYINSRSTIVRFFNLTVVFYRAEKSMPEASTWEKSIEAFVLDFDPFRVIEIDVENDAYQNHSDVQINLHDQIFGSISIKQNLVIWTNAAVSESVLDRTVQLENSASINLGNAEIYLKNFIVRNLRAQGVEFVYLVEAEMSLGFFKYFDFNASSEQYYAELDNTLYGTDRYIEL